MIRKIEIINFRSYRHAVFEFDERVNVLVGRGQAGKTNVKRAVEWVRKNRPLGLKYINRFAGDNDLCIVGITVANVNGDFYVEASRARNTKMKYTVIHNSNLSSGTQEFNTVGTKVPDVVTEILNMEEINIHEQLGAPYLVAGSTGEISRAVNRVIEAEEADKWLAELESRRRTNTADIKAREAIIDFGEARIAALAPLDKAGDCLAQADLIERKIAMRTNQATRLFGIIAQFNKAVGEINRVDQILTPAYNLLATAQTVDDRINTEQRKALIIDNALAARDTAAWYDKQYQDTKHRYIETIRELGMCPTCYGPADTETINRIEEEL